MDKASSPENHSELMSKPQKSKKKRSKPHRGNKTVKTFMPDLDNLNDVRNKKHFFKWKSKHANLLSEKSHEPSFAINKKKKKKRQPDIEPGSKHMQQPVKSLREKHVSGRDVAVPKEKLEKYRRGEKLDTTLTRSKQGTQDLKRAESKVKFAVSQAARAELLLQEESGFLEADEGETTADISQHDIAESVDILSAQKYFELKLKDFGPYKLNYTRNGRHLLLGGAKGHLAAIDWQTKKLRCEFNVMETVNDIKWLHQETMFAVAQRQWTYIYDNQGIELHCLKVIDTALRMEFLPYHFLLAAASAKGFLTYIDTSVGKKIHGIYTNSGRLDVMCQNPSNAVIHLGHPGGTVTLWTPNMKSYAAKMLCHVGAVRSIAVDNTGTYMASSGVDGKLKIWDLRTYKMLQSYRLPSGAGSVAFSQRQMVAAGVGNVVQVFKDCCRETASSPYMQHRIPQTLKSVQFCPYEDVLGITHTEGFASLLIPGAGEANFDALEVNPFQTKKQRQQAEVKMLLDKIQPEMITLDSKKVGEIEAKSYDEIMQDEHKTEFLKIDKSQFVPRHKKRGRSQAGKVEQRKSIVKEAKRRQVAEKANKLKRIHARDEAVHKARTGGVLSRFQRKEV